MKVSVLIATKNRPERCREAVAAVLAQDHTDLEVIVKDGGSPLVALDPDPRVFVVHGDDESIPQAYNQAAALATGDIMHCACDDDLMALGTISNAVEVLDGSGWTYAWMRYRQLDPDGTYHEVRSDTAPWLWQPGEMMRMNCVHQPTVFWTRTMWDKLGPFNEEIPYAYDYEFWGRLGAHAEPVVRDHCDAVYTFWPESTSIRIPELLQADVETIQAMWNRYGFGRRATD